MFVQNPKHWTISKMSSVSVYMKIENSPKHKAQIQIQFSKILKTVTFQKLPKLMNFQSMNYSKFFKTSKKANFPEFQKHNINNLGT